MKKLFLLCLLLLFSNLSFSQPNSTSQNAAPLCGETVQTIDIEFDNLPDVSIQNPGNYYDCLSLFQSNPAWYYFKIEDTGPSGSVEFVGQASNSYGYIVYGPFLDFTTMMSYEGLYGTIPDAQFVDCGAGQSGQNIVIPNAQSGEYYLILFTTSSNSPQTQQFNLWLGAAGTLDCDLYQNVPKHFISGTVFYDFNQNGIQDSGEEGIQNVSTHLDPLNQNYFTNLFGKYNIVTDTNIQTNYDLMFNGLEDWTSTTSTSYQFQMDDTSINFVDTLDFGIYPDSMFIDVSADLSSGSIQCILNSSLWMSIENSGSLPMIANVVVEHSSDFTYLSSDFAADSAVNNIIYFSDVPVSYMNSNTFAIKLSTTGNLQAGDTVCFYYTVDCSDTSHTTQQIITDSICFIVECSYDPNDKTPFINGYQVVETIDTNDFIEYLINFENTGNAQAVDVEIIDELALELDISTFEFIGSSHPVFYSIDANRRLTIRFEDIMLPWTQPESKGFFKFRISQTQGLLPNETIENTAEIYFDNNDPIITNTTLNVIECYIEPDQPILAFDQFNTISSGLGGNGYTFEWYLNGNLLAGETNEDLIVSQNGTYVIEVSNSYGCISTGSIVVNTLSLMEKEVEVFNIYPNPFENEFKIQFKTSESKKVEIADLSGKVLERIEVNGAEIMINAEDFDAGVYLINVIYSDDRMVTKKLIKN